VGVRQLTQGLRFAQRLNQARFVQQARDQRRTHVAGVEDEVQRLACDVGRSLRDSCMRDPGRLRLRRQNSVVQEAGGKVGLPAHAHEQHRLAQEVELLRKQARVGGECGERVGLLWDVLQLRSECGDLKEMRDSLREAGRLAAVLNGAFWNANAREFAPRPDMRSAGEIGRCIEAAALDADCAGCVAVAMPEACSARAAEIAHDRAAGIGVTRPASDVAACEAKVGAPDDHRYAKRRSALLLAFPAMAHIDSERRAADLVARLAALAGAGQGAGHGRVFMSE